MVVLLWSPRSEICIALADALGALAADDNGTWSLVTINVDAAPRVAAMVGVEAVIDKDLAAAMLAQELDADLLVIATDVDGVYTGWGTPAQTKLGAVTVEEVVEMTLPAGSMGPKVSAACQFATNTGNEAVIGSLVDIDRIVEGSAGTRVRSA